VKFSVRRPSRAKTDEGRFRGNIRYWENLYLRKFDTKTKHALMAGQRRLVALLREEEIMR